MDMPHSGPCGPRSLVYTRWHLEARSYIDSTVDIVARPSSSSLVLGPVVEPHLWRHLGPENQLQTQNAFLPSTWYHGNPSPTPPHPLPTVYLHIYWYQWYSNTTLQLLSSFLFQPVSPAPSPAVSFRGRAAVRSSKTQQIKAQVLANQSTGTVRTVGGAYRHRHEKKTGSRICLVGKGR